MEKTDIKSMDFSQLAEFVESIGEKKFRTAQIYKWLHVKHAASFDEMTDLSASLREKLKEMCTLTALKIVKVLTSKEDGTKKYLFSLADGNIIESVFMRYHHGNSVCISTQVGCRMGCRFCASTIDGLERNLTPAEMLDEIYAIIRDTKERVSNIVLMGSGEPLDNFDNVVKFIKLITDENGENISQRNITLSTCGLVSNIKRLADLQLAITLAISLHASDDETRRQLMPIANKYSIEEIIDAVKYFFEKTGRRITFEYSLVAGVNDTKEEAMRLISVIKGINCHVNLIPVNPIKERDYKQSKPLQIKKFQNIVEQYGINVTIRREMGRDINGACGQLRKSYMDNEIKQEKEGEG